METLIEIFDDLKQDAVIWKGKRIWNTALTPDEQAVAVEKLAEMLLCIGNDTKREAYIKKLANDTVHQLEDVNDEIRRLEKIYQPWQRRIEKLQAKIGRSDEENQELEELNEKVEQTRLQVNTLKTSRPHELDDKALRKRVNAISRQRADEKQNKKMQAEFEKGIRSADDAGLPEDFEGSMKDVYDALKYGIYVHEKVYYSRGGSKGDYRISNFTMRIIYHIPTNDETSFRLIAVKHCNGFEVVININTDDFVSVGSFKKILARRGDFVFMGGDADLCRLQEFLQKDETSAQRIDVLGWNKAYNFWAWSNGLTVVNRDNTVDFLPVDDHGIVEHAGKRYFIPACSSMYSHKDGMYVNEKKFVYCPPIEGFGFAEWADVMYKAYGKKSIAAILWYIASLFRDVVMKKVRRLPLLNLFGPPGAGKGELYDSLMHLFGYKQDQIMLGGASTVVGFMRKFAQFYNAVVGLDEYKNNLPQKIIESLKNLYDGIGYERGKMTNDFSTESTPVNGSCVLMGQDMPTIEPALFMRCIMLAFQEGKFTDLQRVNYKKLKDDYEPNGLSYITAQLLQLRPQFEANFKDEYGIIFKSLIKDVANPEVDDRMVMNIGILLTAMHITAKVLKFPFTYKEAKDWLIDNMMNQHTVLAGNNDVAKFWGVIESLFYRDQVIEERDFKLDDGYLYIRIQQVHPLYQKEMLERRDMNFLAKPTLEHYLTLDTNVFCGKEKKQFKDGSYTGCFKFKYSKLGIDLIRIKKEQYETLEQYNYKVNSKYREMGIQRDDAVPDDGLPFPPVKN